MTIHSLLENFDRSLGAVSAPPTPKRRTGRRLLLGGFAAALAVPAVLRMRPAVAEIVAVPEPALPEASAVAGRRLEALRLQPCSAERRDWNTFLSTFIQDDGRVIDTFAHGKSHTESQGLGMLFAVAFNDRAVFDRIWNWTSSHLSRPTDALHAWEYIPGSADPVPDHNNATDGDIYIASALVRASDLWNEPEYLRAGKKIAQSILALLVRNVGGRTILLPGVNGFEKGGEVLVNASYYVFPMLADLQGAHPSPVWAKLIRDAHQIVAEAQYGKWRLPPDWLSIDRSSGALSIASQHPPRFSYDAIRIPLFAAWDGASRDTLKPFADFWGVNPSDAPAWVDLKSNAGAPYNASGGITAIAKVVGHDNVERSQAGLPAIAATDDYYSAALVLLSRLALREMGGRIA